MTTQLYETYWQLTLEYSDIYEANFNRCLGIIIAFIDTNSYLIKTNPSEAYQKLQSELEEVFKKNDSASTRKSINQFIKLGFVEPGLVAYHPDTKQFLSEQNPAQKRTIFSRIVYSNASFNRSFTKKSDAHQVNFLLKTLSEVGQLTKDDTLALMTVDIENIDVDHLNAEALAKARAWVESSGFADRKYNQVNYLWNILKKLDDLAVQNDVLYMESDPRVVVVETDTEKARTARDAYLQKLYKNQLKEESKTVFGNVVCMTEELDYPVLIASHIKPYSLSNDTEAFDPNNGLLLSTNMDQLFDKGYITFDPNGHIVVSASRGLSEDLIKHLSQFSLRSELLFPEREVYMQFHREQVFQP